MKIHTVKTRLANAIVVDYTDRIFVVDVAIRCHRYVLGYVEETLDRPIEDISLVTCTHDDVDHMGGIKRFAELSGAQIAVPYASGDLVHKFLNDPFGGMVRATTGFREAFRSRTWAMYANPERDAAARKHPRYEGAPRDEVTGTVPQESLRLKDGDTLPGFDDWQILHTPGHSWDSCCFYHAKSGSLISGDTLLGSRKQERVVLPAIYANRLHFANTLKKLKDLDIRAVYPGHGKVIEGRNLLDRLGKT